MGVGREKIQNFFFIFLCILDIFKQKIFFSTKTQNLDFRKKFFLLKNARNCLKCIKNKKKIWIFFPTSTSTLRKNAFFRVSNSAIRQSAAADIPESSDSMACSLIWYQYQPQSTHKTAKFKAARAARAASQPHFI